MSRPSPTRPTGPVERTDVLVVGGSLVGLSTAMFLAWHGIRPVVVERRELMGTHPRAWGYHPRTMEMLTEVGLLDAVTAAGPEADAYRDVLKVGTLAGEELGRYDPEHLHMSHRAFGELSPAPYSLCAQHRLEPILRQRAEELGADVRFGVELLGFVDGGADGADGADGKTVRATVRDTTGAVREIHASYLVAADGVRGTVRDALGIATSGVRGMAHVMNVLFEADLSAALRGRTFFMCHLERPAGAVLNFVDGVTNTASDRWQLHLPFDPNQGQRPGDFTEERCLAAIRTAIGIPDLAARIVQAVPWEVAGYSADRYSRGRVFLVGDAAHVMPPAGAFGANTGIHDAHNLAWKLAAVLRGVAGPGLLDTYDAERRPVAEWIVEQAQLRAVHQFLGDPSIAEFIVDDRVIIFGTRYRSRAVPGSPAAADAQPFEGVRPVGTPGTRVPYVPLTGAAGSTLDLVGPRPLLLAGPDGVGWCAAAGEAARRIGIEVRRVVVTRAADAADPADVDEGTEVVRAETGAFPDATGTGPGGALLVRPDGVVAWRAAAPAPADAAAELAAVLGRLLDRTPAPDQPPLVASGRLAG